jgi:predicted RNA-binding protein associated with RNAse of E/G family
MSTVRIFYERPGKDIAIYTDELISVDTNCLVTIKNLPAEDSARLELALLNQGLIQPGQHVASIRKVYHFHEHFDLLEFRSPNGELVGHYSDIGLPLVPFGEDYAMLDLFLDIWLSPDGKLVELDWDELEDARAKNLVTPEQVEIASQTMQRLVHEAAEGTYPSRYLK